MVERASAQLCPVSPSPCKKITAAVSRSAPDTVAASVSRGTDMVLPHIHCRASCRLGLTPSGFRDRSGDSPLSPAQAHTLPPRPPPPELPFQSREPSHPAAGSSPASSTEPGSESGFPGRSCHVAHSGTTPCDATLPPTASGHGTGFPDVLPAKPSWWTCVLEERHSSVLFSIKLAVFPSPWSRVHFQVWSWMFPTVLFH